MIFQRTLPLLLYPKIFNTNCESEIKNINHLWRTIANRSSYSGPTYPNIKPRKRFTSRLTFIEDNNFKLLFVVMSLPGTRSYWQTYVSSFVCKVNINCKNCRWITNTCHCLNTPSLKITCQDTDGAEVNLVHLSLKRHCNWLFKPV